MNQIYSRRAIFASEKIIHVLLLISGLVLLFSGALKLGISTDEPYYLESTQNYLTDGWYLPDGYLAQLIEGEDNPNKYVYGPIPDIFSHQINYFLGEDQQNLVSDSARAYEVRHLTISFIFFIIDLYPNKKINWQK